MLTVAQEQMLALHESDVDPAAVNLSYALEVDGPLDLGALERALFALAERHEPLRMHYGAAPRRDAGFDGIFREGAPVVDQAEAVELAREQRSRAFDLTAEPPLRLVVHPIAPRRRLLLLTLHHVAADGWGIRVSSTELSTLYTAFVRDEPVSLSPSPLSCSAYAERERRWLAGEEAERELAWWCEHLDGASFQTLAPDRGSDGSSVPMNRQTVLVPDKLTRELRELARGARVSTFVLLQAAFGIVLGNLMDSEDVVSGTLVANRGSADSAGLLGAHFNPMLLRTDLSGNPTLAECILRTGGTAVEALDHQALPYPVIAAALEEGGWDADATPTAMLLLDRYPAEALAFDGCEVAGLHAGVVERGRVSASTTAALSFCVREVGDRLTLSALSVTALRDNDVARLIADYIDVLALMCETPDLSLDELPDRLDLSGPGAVIASVPTLQDVAEIAPVDALSPVGCWDRHQ